MGHRHSQCVCVSDSPAKDSTCLTTLNELGYNQKCQVALNNKLRPVFQQLKSDSLMHAFSRNDASFSVTLHHCSTPVLYQSFLYSTYKLRITFPLSPSLNILLLLHAISSFYRYMYSFGTRSVSFPAGCPFHRNREFGSPHSVYPHSAQSAKSAKLAQEVPFHLWLPLFAICTSRTR